VPFSEHHPRLKNPESTLAFLVHLSAIMLFTALGTAVTPHTWMGAIHRQIGLGELPRDSACAGFGSGFSLASFRSHRGRMPDVKRALEKHNFSAL
jgi:hypothetical protein